MAMIKISISGIFGSKNDIFINRLTDRPRWAVRILHILEGLGIDCDQARSTLKMEKVFVKKMDEVFKKLNRTKKKV